MNFHFNTIQRSNGLTFPYQGDFSELDNLEGYKYHINVDDFSTLFYYENFQWHHLLWVGWNNYENYSFNEGAYNTGDKENIFIPFEYWNCSEIKTHIRRGNIGVRIRQKISNDTELKWHRKCNIEILNYLKSIGADFSDIEKYPAINAFKSMSSQIEECINEHNPKEDYLQSIDVKKENGI
jgi:hypothetical protein